ncbi:CPBP family intramembrane glutamic endopeptidase [Naasia sp. SYSU D00948]|uniref:CPBP family intramembrane glutamic endopeptidase n=1 Tax=Naasia sp. SYSU D00948 TaxID=2817379 RepID=UPI001B316E3E|nr:CPBP family intramembrane glutamic endopeptidase [Naasia sp. SYSU D00948]
MTTLASAPTASRPRLSTRRQLAVFFVTLAALVLPAVAYAVSQGIDLRSLEQAPVGAQLALFAQSLAPALAALLTWAVGGAAPVWGFRRMPWRTMGAGWLIGLLAVGLAYGTAWLLDLAPFSPEALSAGLGLPAPVVALIGLLPGLIPYLLLAMGEQLGWSSFLVPRLAETRSPAVVAVLLGLAWASFHLPLMLFVPGAIAEGVPGVQAVALFTVQCVALAFPLTWLRLRTGSIWPVLVLHATLNAAIYLVAKPATVPTAGAAWWLGEGGVLTTAGVVAAVLATIPLWHRRLEGDARG